MIDWIRRRRARAASRKVAAPYQAGIRSVTNAPLPQASRWLLGTLILLVFAILVWASVGRLDVTATAQGMTVVSSRVKPVQAPDQTVVGEILVESGDRVTAGQPVIRMRADSVKADVRNYVGQLSRTRAAAARVDALLRAETIEADGASPRMHVPPDVSISIVKQAQRYMQSQWRAYQDRLSELRHDRTNQGARIETIEASVASIDAVLPYLEGRVERLERLVRDQAASRQKLDDARRELVTKQEERRVEQRRLVEARSKLAGVGQRIRGLRSQFREQKSSELAELGSRIARLQQKLAKARSKLESLTLRAPIAGVVQDVAVHSSGAVTRPADILMRIVPEGQALEVEAKILNRDIGFASEGQKVDVKFQAFDFTRYGAVQGVIHEISLASTDDEKLGRVYNALIELEKNHILANGEQRSLRPGLMATIDIDMGSRRVIEYFLEPILRYRDQALNER